MSDTDAAYLILLAAHSHIGGHYYFNNRMPDYYKGTPIPNGPIDAQNRAFIFC